MVQGEKVAQMGGNEVGGVRGMNAAIVKIVGEDKKIFIVVCLNFRAANSCWGD
jgi:hypothetical protein